MNNLGIPREISKLLIVTSDRKFKDYFQHLQQVFIYVTNRCNLHCEQCLYKPWLRQGEELKVKVGMSLLAEFRKMGADKLSILGGEPFIYKQLPELIKFSKEVGYNYIRLDTNGQFNPKLLETEGIFNLDEITFSLDGDNPDINDPLRGIGVFNKCVRNIRKAISLGYNVNITCCVHRGNIGRDKNGGLLIDRMICFAESLGVSRINFHPLFKMGVSRDEWAGETDIDPDDWRETYEIIRANIDNLKYKIPVRIPQRFLNTEKFDENPAYYGYCPAKMGERVLIHPNGQIQICALMIGTTNSVAHYKITDNEIHITWENNPNLNELSKFDLDNPTCCTNQTRDFGNLTPLCISFKPKQDEYIWERLDKKWVLKFRE